MPNKNYMTLDMNYLSQDAYKDGFNQIYNTPNGSNCNASSVTALYDNGILDETDIEIVDFIYRCTICTYEQIAKFFSKIKPEELKKRVSTLYINVIINRFIMGNKKELNKKVPNEDDVRFFYCLNSGGNVILSHYKYDMNFINWEPEKVSMSRRNVRRILISNEFYLGVYDKTQVTYYKSLPEYHNRDLSPLIPSVELRYKTKDEKDAVIVADILDGLMDDKRLEDRIRNYGYFFGTNSYKKFFMRTEKPVLLLVTENDNHAISLLDMYEHLSQYLEFEVTTVERMSEGLFTPGSLLVYNDGTLYEKETGIFK